MISQHSKQAFRNPWVIGMIGLIVLVVGVNGAFIWYSLTHRSSLVDHEYSSKDRKSDTAELREIEAHRALAWKTTVKQPDSIVMNAPVSYEISVADRDGAPVSGTMEVEALRPSDANEDFTIPFKEVVPGTYQGYITFPLKGFWELRIRVKRGEDVFSVDTRRFPVAP